MGKMYPNDQSLDIFGERVLWPGMGSDGKFTNGSFEDPMVKPSFIPAQTLNLILDNLGAIVEKCGQTPDAVGANQIAELMTHLAVANRLILRDEHGRARVAAPEHEEDIARLADVNAAVSDALEEIVNGGGVGGGGGGGEVEGGSGETAGGGGYNLAEMVEGYGRNLMEVLEVGTVAAAGAALHRLCNNNGEIDASGIPDFRGLQTGDYLDGLDLSSIPAENGGTAGRRGRRGTTPTRTTG